MAAPGVLFLIRCFILAASCIPRTQGDQETPAGTGAPVIDCRRMCPSLATATQCLSKQKVNLTTACTSCAASHKVLCPVGSKKITQGAGVTGCRYTVDMGGVSLLLSGCSHTCEKMISLKECCPGRWGSACHECPGGWKAPCSGHGTCLDGVTGNGTCLCDERFGGFACQECADENAFGPDCASACNCKFGVCRAGIAGDGSCTCQAGYTGPKCDQEHPACKALDCGENSYCKDSADGGPTCECLPGYEKNGPSCTRQDPCHISPCSPLADCSATGKSQPTCTCKSGYQGDGKVCIPINPCTVQNGGCLGKSTRCVYEGPNKSSCVCERGMKTTNISAGCYANPTCKPTTCGKSAQCEPGPDQTFRCVCQEGEISDSRNCYGNIMRQIQSLNTVGQQTGKLSYGIRMLEEGCALTLRKLGPFTVFVPVSQTAIDSDLAPFLCKLHIIPGVHLAADLNQMKTLWTLGGESMQFKGKAFTYTSSPNVSYFIMSPNQPAANGVIHIIDKARTTVTPSTNRDAQLRIGDILQNTEAFSRFQTMLENCGLPPILEGPGPFTVFVPSNKAVDALRDGRLIYLFTQAKNKLQELVKNHIFSTAAVTLDKLMTMSGILTMANELVTLNISRDGQILLGESGAVIGQRRDILASNGIIHALDGVLVPSSILPILPHRCPEVTHRLVTGPCSHCDSPAPCPANSTDLGTVQMGCLIELDYKTNQLGCARYCNQAISEPGCCKGFFGPDCRQCPAGFSNPCFGRGLCSDGIQGNGSCMCFEDYKGMACHICSNPNRHGENCEEECKCVHGICDNRPGSGGVCQTRSCKEGFTGVLCDRRAVPCGPSGLSQYCHLYAVCEMSGDITRCVCADGYEGDGFSCQPVDLCSRPERGGCSENALCNSTGPGTASCQCNPGWAGDGRVCLPIDNCQLESRGGCHVNADCAFVEPGKNKCTCKRGYAGDGYLCDLLNPCLENNGDCHDMAECRPLGAGERTCICPENFRGDGMTCYGDVLYELESNPDFADFNEWTKQKSAFLIPGGTNVTVLVPSEAAIKNLSQEVQDLWLKPYMLPFLLRAHFLRGSFVIDQLKEYIGQELSTLNPRTKWEIRDTNNTVMIDKASIVVADIPAANGIIHIINKVLIPFVGDVPPSHPGLQRQLDLVTSFTEFKDSLQLHRLSEEVEASGSKFTIFVPGGEAVAEYFNASHTETLDNETLKYHIILGEKLRLADLKDGMHRSTMLGSSFWLTFYRKGNQTYVNDVSLDGSVFETKNGVIIGVSQVLRIQKNHCDVNKPTVVKSKCSKCARGIVCPVGTLLEPPLQSAKSDCVNTKALRNIQGCMFKCTKVSVIPGCCEGYFGHQCLMCPGKPGNWCSGNGICQDGINGTGECICHEGFHGTACETCEPGRYGKDCKSECPCVHGRCRDGVDGDGSCDCYKGWRGFTCAMDIDSDLCNGTCSHYANCFPGPADSEPTCSCSAGYIGNGTHCTEFDPCSPLNSGCSANANCTRVAVGERICTCREGYTGDGILCLEIDGCQESNGGCHVNAECTKTGPNLVACNCLPGYGGDGRQSCKPIDLCKEDKGGCSQFANCEFTGPATRNCSCKKDYVGDGITCVGKISVELNHNPAAAIFNQFLRANKIKDLTGEGPYTVFVPHENLAWNVTTMKEWAAQSLARDLLLYHAVGCHQMLLSDLQSQTSITSLMGGRIAVSTNEGGEVYLNNEAKIIKSDLIAKNGVIHFIDRMLLPYNLEAQSTPLQFAEKNITEAARNYGFSIFSRLLQDANLLSLVTDPVHLPFTMLWPTDAAFGSLSENQQRYLYHEDHRDKLAAYLKVLMIRDVKIVAANLPLVHVVRTMYGSTISFKCSKDDIGALTVGEENARIIRRHMEFNGGIAHGIDQLLEPPNLGAQCDRFITVELSSTELTCGSCSFVPACPRGSTSKGEYNHCKYPFRHRWLPFPHRTSRWQRPFNYVNDYYDLLDYGYHQGWKPQVTMINGCRKRCFSTTWTPECCKNHYGRECRACPGGLESPCSNHGECKDGISESGECVCFEGFNGTACELCAPGRYSPACLACNCTENGACDEGVSGDGSCFCNEGWTGKSCEIQQEVLPLCSPACHINATCRSDNLCACHPYYEGDGWSCTVMDRCAQYNGGCSEYALCTQQGVHIQCQCLEGYRGDGVVCIPIDRCADGQNGGCSEHATCISTGPNSRRCECREGYVGTGIQCLPKAEPPLDRCLEANGGCHAEAVCADLHYQEKTAGVFHLQSRQGKYSLTYEEAEEGCAAEGATLATFQQLSAAQQFGLHLCLVGWMDNRTAGYPTTFPNPSCGDGHVGIVDYGPRSNLSEKWDAFCFRVKDVQCTCRDGYVGDGNFCNGNLLEVLASTPHFSIFHLMLLGYANATDRGLDFLDFLSNETSYKTLFVPLDSSFEENMTLTWRDIEHHVSVSGVLLVSYNLTEGSLVPSRTGYNLSISTCSAMNCTSSQGSMMVNNRVIVDFDIFAFNGIIHSIRGPLAAPLETVFNPTSPHSYVARAVIAAAVVGGALVILAMTSWCYFKHRDQEIQFHYFKAEMQEGTPSKQQNDNPPIVNIPNPVYGAHDSFFEAFGNSFDDDNFSDTHRILGDD
ncbi:stabilin-1 isoform X1 [Pleurodeles waltl]|uniref:stabilin-1 isoform X1 n=1 Tax=Pleurodeles waltl TaxID=8319 RepID=UPI0037097255